MRNAFIFLLFLLVIACNSNVDLPQTDESENLRKSRFTKPDLSSKAITGLVIEIADGDTLIVLDENKNEHAIRLLGIDSPENEQAFGPKAKQSLAVKVFKKQVRVDWKQRDNFGRILGNLYHGERLINLEMVEDGWAWHYKQYSNDKTLAAAEIRAKAARRGLWSDSQPVPPWDFRHPQGRASNGSPAFDKNDSSVYITRRGSKYHRASCRYLKRSKIPISLKEAIQRYSACSVCRPATKVGSKSPDKGPN